MRFIVTSFQAAGAKYLYETAYCGRGKMELMIKDHKTALKSDRTSCHRKEANPFRLFLHSAAYVLMHALRDNLLKGSELARAQFDTLRLKLLKIGARLEAGRSYLRFHFPAACPVQAVFSRMSSILGVLNTAQVHSAAVPRALKIREAGRSRAPNRSTPAGQNLDSGKDRRRSA